MKMRREELVSPEASPALGPYCHGRKYGDMIITSGQIPLTKDGEYVFEIKQATTLVLNNLLSIVEAGGCLLYTSFAARGKSFPPAGKHLAE